MKVQTIEDKVIELFKKKPDYLSEVIEEANNIKRPDERFFFIYKALRPYSGDPVKIIGIILYLQDKDSKITPEVFNSLPEEVREQVADIPNLKPTLCPYLQVKTPGVKGEKYLLTCSFYKNGAFINFNPGEHPPYAGNDITKCPIYKSMQKHGKKGKPK